MQRKKYSPDFKAKIVLDMLKAEAGHWITFSRNAFGGSLKYEKVYIHDYQSPRQARQNKIITRLQTRSIEDQKTFLKLLDVLLEWKDQ